MSRTEEMENVQRPTSNVQRPTKRKISRRHPGNQHRVGKKAKGRNCEAFPDGGVMALDKACTKALQKKGNYKRVRWNRIGGNNARTMTPVDLNRREEEIIAGRFDKPERLRKAK